MIDFDRDVSSVRKSANKSMTKLTSILQILALLAVVTVSGCGGGSADYSTREPPTATISSVQSGDRLLTVKYVVPSVPPGASLASIALVTATCTAGGDQRSATATDSNSPIEISNLQNGVEYSCTVTTKAVSGVTRTSAPVKAIPNPTYSISVVPGVNGSFLSGARVDVYSVSGGQRLSNGSTGSNGRAGLTFAASPGDIILVVVAGSPTARFYSYTTDSLLSFGENRTLYSLIPVAAITAPQTPVAVNPITSAIALAAGLDPAKLPTGASIGVTVSSLATAVARVLIALGVDPSTYSPSIVPALLSNADLGRRVFVSGTDPEIVYGLLLVAMSSLRTGNEDLLSFVDTFVKALADGKLPVVFQNISTILPAKFEVAKETLVDPARRSSFSTSLTPEAARYDYAVFDQARYQ